MKLAVAALALTASTYAQDCRTKQGQVQYIRGLISQWTLYKKQVAANAELTTEQGDVETERAGKEQDLIDFNNEKLSNLTIATAARKLAINNEATTAKQNVDTELQNVLSGIAAEELRKTTAISNKAADFTSGVNSKISALQWKKNRIGLALTGANAKAGNKKTFQLGKAQAKYDAALLNIEAVRDAKLSKARKLHTAKVLNNTNTETARLLANKQKYDAQVAALEASKLDAAATLASLDNAGTTGLPFPADCLLEVDDVIAEVKQDKRAADIWRHLITPGYY